MSYATILVYVDADSRPRGRICIATGLADRFSATLIGMSALAVRPPFVAEGVVIDEVAEPELRRRLVEQERWFGSIAGADRLKVEWRSAIDIPTDALARESCSADLLVIGQGTGPVDIYSALDPGGFILRAGRPVLVTPEKAETPRGEHILIGWKDTREARRAVRDALPLLRRASRVTVTEICGTGEEEAARRHIEDVIRYLERHRVACGSMVILHQEGSGAVQLIRLAQQEDADLIVTGAYGHSRLGEWVFGGMTHDLLTASPICCLMSH